MMIEEWLRGEQLFVVKLSLNYWHELLSSSGNSSVFWLKKNVCCSRARSIPVYYLLCFRIYYPCTIKYRLKYYVTASVV